MGGKGRHTAAELSFFQNGETGMVYAVDAGTGRVVFLPRETEPSKRAEYRSWAKEQLRCVVERCRAELTVRFCTNRRDHFAHMPGAGHVHSPETIWHQMAKAAIVHWAQAYHPAMTASAEVSLGVEEAARRPDVTIAGATGHRVFVEIQYSGLTPGLWLRRHEDLTRGGDAAVWLLGHVMDHARVRGGELMLSPLVQAMAGEGVTPLWINPLLGAVATGFGPSDRHGPTTLKGCRVCVDFLPTQELVTCQLTRDGIVPSRLEQLRRAEQSRQDARRARVASGEAARRRQAALRELAELQREHLVSAWLASQDSSWMGELHGGTLPGFIREDERTAAVGAAVGLSAVHWQVMVYRHMLVVRPAGEWVTFFDLVKVIGGGRGRDSLNLDHLKTVQRLLTLLERADVVELRLQPGHALVDAVRTPPTPPDLGAESPREASPAPISPGPVTERAAAAVQTASHLREPVQDRAGVAAVDSSWQRALRAVRRWFSA